MQILAPAPDFDIFKVIHKLIPMRIKETKKAKQHPNSSYEYREVKGFWVCIKYISLCTRCAYRIFTRV